MVSHKKIAAAPRHVRTAHLYHLMSRSDISLSGVCINILSHFGLELVFVPGVLFRCINV